MSATILLVEDDFDVRDALHEILADEGYIVATASDGLEALEYLRAHPAPCVILLDWMMPRCDALEFRTKQKADPTLAAVPIVLLSADAQIQQKMELVGADTYLSKPLDLQKLLDLIKRYCSRV